MKYFLKPHGRVKDIVFFAGVVFSLFFDYIFTFKYPTVLDKFLSFMAFT